jgi:type IV secretory pathway TrbD component
MNGYRGSEMQSAASESMAGGLIAFSVTMALVNVIVVALRFYVRIWMIRKFGLDDWAVAATLVRFMSRYSTF